MSLAEKMDFSTGYSVEPYELINILEKYGGIIDKNTKSTKDFVEVFQIETRNPHFHENKGDEHITGMLYESLNIINNSKICNTEITKDIKNHLIMLQHKVNNGNIKLNGNNNDHIMAPINTIPIDKFKELVIDSPQLLHMFNI